MSSFIEVSNVNKAFKVSKRSAGIPGMVANMFLPKYEVKRAVSDISFTIEQGEMVGFIGPNGAGKSTTIKMLSGILHPDSGEIKVNGYTPYKQRKDYVGSIGVVFGQKSQLQWDLPVIDSFELLKDIYRIPGEVYKKNFDRFVETRRFPIKNKPAIFGNQLLIGDNDEIVGEEEILLINAVNLSLDEAHSEVTSRGGVCYPAHIDRTSNGIIAMLGDFPPEPEFTSFELNDAASLERCRQRHPILTERNLTHIAASDAHYLTDIAEEGFPVMLDDEPYSSALVRNRLIDYLLKQEH